MLSNNKYEDKVLNIVAEQSPTLNSKLKFEDGKGELNWSVSDFDFKNYDEYFRRYAGFMQSNDFGKTYLFSNGNYGYFSPYFINGCSHHMGTVRYSKENAFVNKYSKYIGTENVYILGSSMFPVSGYENPTHTIICSTIEAINKSIDI